MLILICIVILFIGLIMRFNPLVVVTFVGFIIGYFNHLSLKDILNIFGESFVQNRYMSLYIFTLPVIGVLQRHGLIEQAHSLVSKFKMVTSGRILILYLFIRQVTTALGLSSIGGHTQMVYPLVSPMAESAAISRYGKLPKSVHEKIKAFSASVDNIGLFFGETLFITSGTILLMTGFYEQNKIKVEPLDFILWGLPFAFSAFVIHSMRLILFDRAIQQELQRSSGRTSNTTVNGESEYDY
ncbi:DUF969 domain-containing protein [Bacillus cereus]|uniref:DUF969 domain-containing protein n=1 Tax=Bacillus cereus TaxID=1396 RepID=UPI00065A687D|nr:DUF969 domain-containing protein [Bacillus cereus]KLA35448.1 hypothetical protein B4080_3361 [Bacillus cereus]PED02696.1 DUF969 domain-containing protein [Bacillus cereus]PED87752.1 DUF969 domain-containing protein [Bacillus cereus]PEQ80813.1 DUF969 domain-containing protein [Bacillus cereus]PER61140.1 DUF969 domain-containing protein [Bacillus cereus]